MLILLLLNNLFAATTISPESFDELLNRAPTYQAASLNNQSIEAKSFSRANLFAPTLSVKAGVEQFSLAELKNKTQSYGSIEARVNLFSSGKDLARFKQHRFEAQITQEETKAKRGDLLALLYEQYFHALAIQEKMKILNQALVTNERHQSMANRRLKAGLVTNTDILDFSVYDLKIKEALIKQKLSLHALENNVRSMLGLKTGEKIIWNNANDFHHSTSQQAGTRTEKLMQLAINASQSEMSQKSAWWKPKLDLVGKLSQLTQREEDYSLSKDRQEKVLALELSFDFDFANSPWTEANSAALMSQSIAQNMRQQLLSVKEQAHYVSEAENLYQDQLAKVKEHTEIAKRHLKQTLDEYSRGVKNAPDVLGASERVVESELELIDAKLELQNVRAHKLRLGAL